MALQQDEHLVRMVNQIAANLGGGRDEVQAVESIRNHVEKFWARSMKQRLIASLAKDDNELAPLARLATQQLAERQAQKER
ncbi:formate dehydrogenase subunit delta [Halomonas huangheensis]|uniref:Formate dehydrogenase subunit delta n=1 Tax=Halomonas huangheensis TaxID=1178482 RepID=W1NAN3_9GAMM|nr:formate dehydrogenase subunit delta [Halomonas huangheensis]ALM53369.1 hypothetical protein AR456_14610 [Halomonas huangheensis]ERL51980.1 hypothetical protein BJB45_12495 [Halomonas huangheensis]